MLTLSIGVSRSIRHRVCVPCVVRWLATRHGLLITGVLVGGGSMKFMKTFYMEKPHALPGVLCSPLPACECMIRNIRYTSY